MMQTLDVDTLVAKIAHELATFDGETIAEIANKVLTEKVKYIGDSMFEYGKPDAE
jgi:hypothetical protein